MKKNYLEILFRIHMSGVPITLRSVPSKLLVKKMNIVESLVHFKGENIYSYGASCISKDIAHAKCVAETIERLFIPHFEEGGVGVDFDKERACFTALYELVERDAFMPYFLVNGLPIRLINPSIIQLELYKYGISNILRESSYMFFDITNDLGIPSIVACIKDKKSSSFGVGIKSNGNPKSAILGAFEEALLGIALRKSGGNTKKPGRFQLFSMSRFKSIFLTGDPHITCRLPEKVSFQNIKSAISYLNTKKHSFATNELTPRLLKNTNYHVIRISSRTLQKVFFSEERKNINKKRLENIERYYTIMKQNYEKNSALI